MKRASELDPPPAKRVAIESQDGTAVASAARSGDESNFDAHTANLDGEVLECDDIVMHVQEDTIEAETNLNEFSESEERSKDMEKLVAPDVNDDSKEQETDEEPAMIENEDKPKPSAKEVANPELSSPKEIAVPNPSSPKIWKLQTAKATQEKSMIVTITRKSKKKTKKVPLSKKKSAKKSDKDKKEGNGHGKGGPKKDGVFSGITKCLACNEDFGNESRLRNHINKKHARDPMAECTICGRDFASEISCRQHRKHIHHKGMWQCRHCNLAYGKYVDCLNHELVHEIKSKKKTR